MEEQAASWKGHTFTLMIFGGIVVLCSIFFVLGMLVGRTQGQKLAGVASAEAATKAAVREPAPQERPELTFYDSVDKNRQPALEQAAKPEPLSPPPAAKPDPPPPPPAASGLSFQVSAMSKRTDAEKMVNQLKKQGFTSAFMLTPMANDAKPVYRVQVGPIADPIEAESIKLKLQAAGYAPIRKP